MQKTDHKPIVRIGTFSMIALIMACAAERPPSGGPPDRQGPQIISVLPANESISVPFEIVFEVIFDELVDPVSVPSSVSFLPEISFTTRVRGRRLLINPDNALAGNQAYVMTLGRGIRDYQGNTLAKAEQLVFSTGTAIPTGQISGRIDNMKRNDGVSVGLFRSDSTADSLYQSIAVSDDGSFSFNYLTDGAYIVGAAAGGLGDFPESINIRPYAMTSVGDVTVADTAQPLMMRLSPPLIEPQISSIQWFSNRYLAITFGGAFGTEIIPASLIKTSGPNIYGYLTEEILTDSINIDLGQGLNRLWQPYTIEPFMMVFVAVEDTLAPTVIVQSGGLTLRAFDAVDASLPLALEGQLTFSEPISLADTFSIKLNGKDSLNVDAILQSPTIVTFRVPDPDSYNRASFLGAGIQDLSGNLLRDSLVTVSLTYIQPQPTGQIRGNVSGIDGPVVVEVHAVDTNALVHWIVVDSSNYLITDVPPGNYKVFAYEQIGEKPTPYFSGRWRPYAPAAKFSHYPDMIEVRPRWEVDGIDINFRAVAIQDTAVEMEQSTP